MQLIKSAADKALELNQVSCRVSSEFACQKGVPSNSLISKQREGVGKFPKVTTMRSARPWVDSSPKRTMRFRPSDVNWSLRVASSAYCVKKFGRRRPPVLDPHALPIFESVVTRDASRAIERGSKNARSGLVSVDGWRRGLRGLPLPISLVSRRGRSKQVTQQVIADPSSRSNCA